MRNKLVLLSLLMGALATASAQQVSIGIWSPNVSIGINLPLYPDLQPVPGYPVYYAPGLDSNYFFYDGMYWVYQDDNWYASSWYNGPWGMVGPEFVPVYVLRIPVRYYRRPPMYFRGWQSDAPPRWGEHWGNDWAQRRNGWDRWDRHSSPARPPLPTYQRKYSGDRYPQMEQQRELQNRNYHYQPHDPVVRQQVQAQRVQSVPAQHGTQGVPQERNRGSHDTQRSNPPPPMRQSTPTLPHVQPQQQVRPSVRQQSQPPQPETTQREQQMPRPGHQGNEVSQQPGREQGEKRDRRKDDDHGQDHGR